MARSIDIPAYLRRKWAELKTASVIRSPLSWRLLLLNLLAPALVLFLINVIAQQNKLVIDGGATTWFMIKKSTFGIPKNQDIGFFGELLIHKVYLSTYVCILLFIVLSVLLYTALSKVPEIHKAFWKGE